VVSRSDKATLRDTEYEVEDSNNQRYTLSEMLIDGLAGNLTQDVITEGTNDQEDDEF
jgi:hypothetical protein